jgi:hypothetical protein
MRTTREALRSARGDISGLRPSPVALVAVMVLFGLVAACTDAAGTGETPSAAEETPVRDQAPTAVEVQSQEQAETAVWPVFAATLASAKEVEHYPDLARMAQASDLVVLGAISEIVAGRVIDDGTGAGRLLFVEFHVDVAEPLKGSGDVVVVEMPMFLANGADPMRVVAELDAQKGSERQLLFLRDKGAPGIPGGNDAEKGRLRLVNGSGLLVDRNGQASLALRDESDSGDPIVKSAEGANFASLLDEVRAAIAGR